MSITSITVEKGYLCWCWFEEAFQVTSEDDFNKIDMSIRGELPEGYFKQITLTLNPWSEKHWIKKRFFDKPDSHTLSLQTNYTCNEFLGKDDIAIFEKMKNESPRRYNIEGLGNWGIAEGLVYNNWQEVEFDINSIEGIKKVYGLDFGYNDPTAFICVGVDEERKTLYIYDEYYKSGMTNKDIADMLIYKQLHKYEIIADSAEPKSIEELRRAGIRRIRGAKKGKDSIINGIKKINEYKIIVHPCCEKTIIELSNYVWDNKNGVALDKPIDDYCHLMDALRYSLEYIDTNKVKFKTNKLF